MMIFITTKLSQGRKTAVTVGFVLSALLVALGLSACDNGTTTTPSLAATATSAGATSAEATYFRYCNACHPGGGRGAGPSLIEEVPKLSDDRLTAIIRNGKQRMPGFNDRLIPDSQLPDLIAYIRALK